MANVNYLNRPNELKVFASNAMHANYLPVRFGTNRVASPDVAELANDNFEYGFESLEGDLQPRDLNSVLKYVTNNLAYLFQQGVAEFSPYQSYPMNALVQYDGGLWISTKPINASKQEPKKDPCNPCKTPDCTVAEYPSEENGWCKLVSHCTYDNELKNLKATDEALQTSIDNLKGVDKFNIVPNVGTGSLELVLALSDGSKIAIPMTKFGHIEQKENGEIHIANADGSKLKLPKYVASKELDQQKGFFWNNQSEKWEVDLADLVKSGSGLEVDRNGNVKVKPADFIDPNTFVVDPATDKVKVKPEWEEKHIKEPIGKAVADAKKEAEAKGSKVYVKAPITGNGLKTEPLELALGEGLEIKNGKLDLANVAPKDLGANLRSAKYHYGFHTFTGAVDSVNQTGTLGLPIDFVSTAHEQHSANTYDAYQHPQVYDYNGYYIASGSEVNVWVSNNISTWYISNDAGVDSYGNLRNATAWTQWQKLDNAGSVTNEMIKSMQDQINGLNRDLNTANQEIRTLKAKNEESCKVPVKFLEANSNYTLQDSDNTIVINSGSINIPDTIQQGRIFTIIQSGTGNVELRGQGNVQVHAPYKGSLKMSGQRATVSIIYEIRNATTQHVQIAGQVMAA